MRCNTNNKGEYVCPSDSSMRHSKPPSNTYAIARVNANAANSILAATTCQPNIGPGKYSSETIIYDTTYSNNAAKMQALSQRLNGGTARRSGFTNQSVLRQQN